ncbi:ParB/RepB/Spo0J family partition protein [Corticibacter populi]|uniref:ParB/RepB/Spo0J family partition protein n=1 Tax=Corticibacter populi TaxID=1550736 RepID=A0A3M6QUN5_9BURK|nr:ParB/RepB/Spo0J family partition protein [Corticibacter populi]RMX06738.1 ParB/RepB/Spo0J family partition protein [Corticibacter populi]RZS31679.1 ParB/RepB/Spo0J family partition protein [Corticibacter populi]
MATDPHDTVTHALPTPGAGPQMRLVARNLIVTSPSNPRKWFDQAKLQELADSIKATGVHQPILLRPLPGDRVQETYETREPGQPLPEFELVCGERRWRACGLADVPEIPAMIRQMTDAQALEAMVIENLQREDVTELEEAEGYRILMDQQGMNADAVGAKIGKSRAYVYARLKVLDLCEHGKQLLREGEIDFSQALPIARIPSEQLQMEVLEQVTDGYYHDEPMGARQVQQLVRDQYMLQLKRAPFAIADADLCPSAGACTTCPNRTGANPDLFADVDSPDVCTNPPCYHAKEAAHAAQVRKQAAERGCEIIDGAAAKKLLQKTGGYLSDYSGIPGYKRLDNANDSPVKGKTLRKLIGTKVLDQSDIKPTMLVDPHDSNRMIACVTDEQARQLLQIAGRTEAQEQLAAERDRQAEHDAEAAEAKALIEYETAWRMDVLTRIVKHANDLNLGTSHRVNTDKVKAAANRLAAQRLAGQLNGDDAKLLCKLLDLGKVSPKDAIKQAAAEWTSPELLTGCIIALHNCHYLNGYRWDDDKREHVRHIYPNTELLAMADACSIDVEACKARAQANARAAAAEAKGKSTESAPTPSSEASADAPQPPLPHRPAARAGEGGKKAKAARGKARATDAPKTTPAEAAAGIAAALQAAEAAAATAPLARAGGDGDPDAAEDGTNPRADAQSDDAPSIRTRLTVGGWARVLSTHPFAQEHGQLMQIVRIAEIDPHSGHEIINGTPKTKGDDVCICKLAGDASMPDVEIAPEHLEPCNPPPADDEEPTPGADAPSDGATNGTPLVAGGWARIKRGHPTTSKRGLLVQLQSQIGDVWQVVDQAGKSRGQVVASFLDPAEAPQDRAADKAAAGDRPNIGAIVIVNDTARTPAQKPWVGYTGEVVAHMGDRAVTVKFTLSKRKTAQITFDHTELELLPTPADTTTEEQKS